MKRLTPAFIIASVWATVSIAATAAERSDKDVSDVAFVWQHAPAVLRDQMVKALPLVVTRGDDTVAFQPAAPCVFEGQSGSLSATIRYKYLPDLQALEWRVHLENTGDVSVENVAFTLLQLRFRVDPERTKRLPRVRHLTGSYHYDACYPPRAFRLNEEAFMTNDHSKPVRIESGFNSAYDHVPILQFALDTPEGLAGLFVGFEWSGQWYLEAGRGGLSLTGNVELGPVRLEPKASLELPVVHLGFFVGEDWAGLENAQRRYIRERLSGRRHGKVPLPTVTYDHWYGIREKYDVELIKRQVPRAAEIGCEYFCLDASWYGKGKFGASGQGEWDEPDPAKFPQGRADLIELSALVRQRGMGFGLWHDLEIANGAIEQVAEQHPEAVANGRIAFDKPDGRELALKTLRKWINTYDLTWMRWELEPYGSYAYLRGLYDVMDTIREEFPDLRIEGCDGGGTNFDWGMSVRTDSTWLSDHTVDPDVVRFMQTSALRFWPAHFLNMAVQVRKGSGDSQVYPHNLLSRMVGAMSFNGDIADWSPQATATVKRHVDVFKANRHLMIQPVYFPLPQPRSTRDWDAVVFGDGKGEGQLLYVFRMEGPQTARLKIPGSGNWQRLLGEETARIAPQQDEFVITLDRYSSALWKRSSTATITSAVVGPGFRKTSTAGGPWGTSSAATTATARRHWPITAGCVSTRSGSATAVEAPSNSTGNGSSTGPAWRRAW